MAQLVGYADTGTNQDFFLWDATGQVWGGSSYGAWSDASYASYRVAATETGTSGKFAAAIPAGALAALDNYDMRFRGGSLALSVVNWQFEYMQTANVLQVGGTAQTARDLGAQLDVAVSTRLAPTTAGRTLDVSTGGEAGIDWANVGSPTTTLVLSGTTVGTATVLTNLPAAPTDWLTAAAVKADAVTKIQTGLATPTNITAGTITTVTNLTNAPTNGDFTLPMKASITTAATAATPTVAAVTGNVGGNVVGSVGSVTGLNAALIDATISSRSTYAGGPVASVTDRSGYSLASTGLDAIPVDAPTGPASTFSEMVVQTWRRFFGKTVLNTNTQKIETYADDGTTVITTQSATNTGGIQTQGPAT